MPSRLRLIVMLLLVFTGLHGRPAAAQPADPVAASIRQQLQPVTGAPATGLDKARAQFYALGDFAPAWTRAADVDDLLAALRGMGADGLDPADYALHELLRQRAALADPQATPMQRASFDLLATQACLTALVDLYRGKVDPASLDTHWNFEPRQPAPGQGVQAVRDALANGQLASLFAQARPQNPLYDELRSALARWREVPTQADWAPIPDGPTLKPGMRDARVPALRRRLRVAGYLPSPVDGAADAGPSDDYDATTEQALRQFQSEQYLTVDGQLDPATRAALNVPAAARIDQLRVNLERARWLLHQLHGDFVMVDIAGYRIAYYRDGKPVWRSRVQVGKPYRSTPAFKSKITYLTLNPTWTVPPTILKNDVLPKVRRNRGYLAANHLRVLDGQGRELAPASVDWANPRGIVLRQDAGPHNSLGRLAIRFPNDYAVYLHDTPHQELFAHPQRANSSGCIRVERPRELAELLLDDPARWSRDAIDRAIDTGKTQNVTLARPVTLLLAYWTVDLHDNGRIGFRPDIYRRDAPLLAALERPRALP
ncbi:L,D-transpeptidase family protein [Rhodanobacter caeni]|uniref:L,D-transpeptidase family protein n=1 Tax=Rhodanobacter caeni TaxID=657654 RepID=A0ABP3EE72_9GAMM